MHKGNKKMQELQRHKKQYNIHTLLFLCICALSIFGVSPYSHAVTIADSPCDDLYYETLSARAWLEAQREITQNQNIILKPDSVFEYTCFDRMLYELADHGDEMLSENSAYGTSSGVSNTSLDSALQDVVVDSLITYIDMNFGSKSTPSTGYNLLGGHTAGAGLYHQPQSLSSMPATYTCNIMSRVWQAAKCINFITNADYDGFYTFEEYATSLDKRHLPTACTPITGNWTGNAAAAITSGPWTNDPVETYFDQIQAEDCASGTCVCNGDPIPTGLKVVRSGTSINEYEEHICLQPGCRYDPASTNCVTD